MAAGRPGASWPANRGPAHPVCVRMSRIRSSDGAITGAVNGAIAQHQSRQRNRSMVETFQRIKPDVAPTCQLEERVPRDRPLAQCGHVKARGDWHRVKPGRSGQDRLAAEPDACSTTLGRGAERPDEPAGAATDGVGMAGFPSSAYGDAIYLIAGCARHQRAEGLKRSISHSELGMVTFHLSGMLDDR